MNNQRSGAGTLFSQLTLTYGPLGVLGRTILFAEQLCNQVGVTLSIVTGAELLAVNQANKATWLPLLRLFDCRFNHLDESNSLFILGRDAQGAAVACQAARWLDLQDTSFAEMYESKRLYYRDPETMAEPGETYVVTSLAARGTTGAVAFTGAGWYRPDYRGKGLVGWLPRISRAYARGVWDARTVVTVMTEPIVKKGVFERAGHRNVEWGIQFNNSDYGKRQVAYLWLKDNELHDDLQQFLDSLTRAELAEVTAVGNKDRG